MTRKHVALAFENRVYKITPGFSLVREIEREIGPVSALAEKFASSRWEVRELVTLTHMMLQAAGRTTDWAELGDIMITEGLGPYLSAATRLLQAITG